MDDNFKIFSFYHSHDIQIDHKHFVYNIYLKIRHMVYIPKFIAVCHPLI